VNDEMMRSVPSIIALLTDFGDQDEYVGVMKGTILCRAPRAVLVDICHQIAPHDIRQASAMIAATFRYFPGNTLFLAVVDPGVGSARGIVFARSRSGGFLCPDNGLLTGLIAQGVLETVHCVTNRDLFANAVGNTFHGRDIMAPVAGFLASGGQPTELGPEQPVGDLVRLEDLPARLEAGGSVCGTIVAVDRFGNGITDIGIDLLTSAWENDLNDALIIETGRPWCMPLVSSYSAQPPGYLLAIIGSRNTLEIAVNMGNAGSVLGITPGTPVRVRRADRTSKDPAPDPSGGSIGTGAKKT
jgi:S-adenosylmethionine hydrolase